MTTKVPAIVKSAAPNAPAPNLVAANAAIAESQGVLAAIFGNEAPVPLTPGQVNKIKAQAGKHMKLVREQSDKAGVLAADNVIATQHGDDLVLRYADGTTVGVEGFFTVCADASVCSVNLPGDAAEGFTISGDSSRGVALGADATLLYAHGAQNVLMTMAVGQPALTDALTALGDAPIATYMPMPAVSPLAGLGFDPSLMSLLSSSVLSQVLGAGEMVATATTTAATATAAAATLVAPSIVVPTTTITGTFVAGAVTQGHGLTVSAFKADGTLLASGGVIDANGRYTLSFNSDYTGPVLLKIVDNGSGADYMDEATGAGKDLNTDLYAVVTVGAAGQALTGNITPLTDLAARKIGLTQDVISGDASASRVSTINNSIAKVFGLTTGGEQITELLAVPVLDASGASQTSNLYGQVLASISGAEMKGDLTTGAVLATLDAGIGMNGTTLSFLQDAGGIAAKSLWQGGVSRALQSGAISAVEAQTVGVALEAQAVSVEVGGNVNAPAPTIFIYASKSSFKAGETATVYFKLSQASTDFTLTDIDVVGGTLGTLVKDGTDPTLYSAIFTPTAANDFSATAAISVAAGKFTNSGAFINSEGVANISSSSLRLSGDTRLPEVTITDNTAGTAVGPVTYTFTFSEAVTGFTVEDVVVGNGTKGAFSAVNATTYTLVVTPTAGFNGNVTVDVAQGAAADVASNASAVAVQSTQAVDGNEAPVVASPIADQSFIAGASNSYSFASTVFSDPDTTAPNNVLTYSATLGNGNALPEWLSFDSATRTFSGTPPSDGATTVRVTATDGGTGALHIVDEFVINAVGAPVIGSAFVNTAISNFDVRSNIVLTASEELDLTGVTSGSKFIHIVNTGGTGYYGEADVHSFAIDVTDASQVTIVGSKIILNPAYDLDFANNYYITIDAGAFHGKTSGQTSLAVSDITAMDFSTVAPGTDNSVSAAVASQKMDSTGVLQSSYKYLDVEGIGNNTGSMTALGSLADGQFALVLKNYDNVRGGDVASGGNGSSDGVVAHDTNIGVTNFGIDDLIYIDSQYNSVISNASERYASAYTLMGDGSTVGGVAGQNLIYFGTAVGQSGSAAHLVVGIEGNSLNTLYSDLPSLMTGRDPVWPSSPVIQG